jgi:cytochrome c oxidase subunit 2
MLQWLPEDVSTFGGEIDSLFYLIYYITAATFILVTVLMIVFLVMYRERPGRRAIYSHGNTTLEIIWTIVPAAILIVLSFMSVSTWAKVKRGAPETDFELQVAAKQFNWEIVYPGSDRKFGTDDDRKFDNDMHVPVNKVVRVHLTATDVIHSFFLPNLRVKQDVVPGMKQFVWFRANKTGNYDIVCAELCGWGHYKMRGRLVLESRDKFEKWFKEEMAQQELAQFQPATAEEE